MTKLEYQEKLIQLEAEHDSLRFETFGSDAAIEIGLKLLEKAKENKQSITIDIYKKKHQLFHCALEGTSEENDQWIVRKNRVALKFCKSSYYISLLIKSKDTTIEQYYKLSSKEYAPYGGAYPVMNLSGVIVGTITVSGLPDYEDHAMVVNAITWYLDKKRGS